MDYLEDFNEGIRSSAGSAGNFFYRFTVVECTTQAIDAVGRLPFDFRRDHGSNRHRILLFQFSGMKFFFIPKGRVAFYGMSRFFVIIF